MFYTWLGVIIVLTIIEVATINLTTIWFVVSGIVALTLSFVVEDVTIQFAVFVLLGILLLVVTKPMLKKYTKVPKVATNLDRIIGMRGIVTEEITNTTGEVKVDGKRWSATALSNLPVGTEVTVLEMSGVKIKVEKEGK